MYNLLLAATAASLALAAPAAAGPGNNNGQGKQSKHAQAMQQGQGQRNGNHGQIMQTSREQQQVKHPKHVRQGNSAANYWGNGPCPPGLAKKNNGCVPPGLAKQTSNIGDRWSGNGGQWNYNQVPVDWRNQYNLNSGNSYYYRNGYLYSVDPKTRMVESVIQAIIR